MFQLWRLWPRPSRRCIIVTLLGKFATFHLFHHHLVTDLEDNIWPAEICIWMQYGAVEALAMPLKTARASMWQPCQSSPRSLEMGEAICFFTMDLLFGQKSKVWQFAVDAGGRWHHLDLLLRITAKMRKLATTENLLNNVRNVGSSSTTLLLWRLTNLQLHLPLLPRQVSTLETAAVAFP